jgi:hypothetical protein
MGGDRALEALEGKLANRLGHDQPLHGRQQALRHQDLPGSRLAA